MNKKSFLYDIMHPPNVFRDRTNPNSDSWIVFLERYTPASHGYGMDSFSNGLLALKNGDQEMVTRFSMILGEILSDEVALACVPSHDPQQPASMEPVIHQLCENTTRVDCCACLRRNREIQSLHDGGERTRKVHTSSIVLTHQDKVKDEPVVLLDDICTTGNSLRVCREILKKAQPKIVVMVAMGLTKGITFNQMWAFEKLRPQPEE